MAGGEGFDALIVRDATRHDLGFLQRMLYEAANRPGNDWPTFEDCMEDQGTGAIGSDG